MGCPQCHSGDVGEIGFSAMLDGMTFRYCRRCENRWWSSDEGPVELDAVLAAATTVRS